MIGLAKLWAKVLPDFVLAAIELHGMAISDSLDRRVWRLVLGLIERVPPHFVMVAGESEGNQTRFDSKDQTQIEANPALQVIAV